MDLSAWCRIINNSQRYLGGQVPDTKHTRSSGSFAATEGTEHTELAFLYSVASVFSVAQSILAFDAEGICNFALAEMG